MIKISAFCWVPPFAQGVVRDLRVRWALEEAGLPYEERLLTPADQNSPEYRDLQPFGQVPSFEEDGLVLFESGAIVLHIAARSGALWPANPGEQARVTTWAFAALNTLEPHVQNLAEMDLFHAGKEWVKERRPVVVAMVQRRLGELAKELGQRHYLVDRFTAADLLMATVLRNLRQTDLLAPLPSLVAYLHRCEERPAFQRALAAQLGVFAAHEPASH